MILVRIFFRILNTIWFYIFKLFPIKGNYIILESEGDLSDNTYALFEYMLKHNYLDKYKFIWLVDNKFNYQDTKSIKYCYKTWSKFNVSGVYYLAVSKNYICDHVNVLSGVYKRKEQKITYLSHGFGFKAGTLKNKDKIKSEFDVMISTGKIPTIGNSLFWKSDVNKVKELGYPRLDYFSSNLEPIHNILNNHYHFSSYNSIILWMPTFRQSVIKHLSEDYIDNETGLPILETKSDIICFDNFLKKNNILFVLKLHHLQANLDIFQHRFNNIIVIKDEKLKEINVQLYQMVACTDALVTDYSSISVDYMLLDKPIIYTLDDYEEYKESRGIYPDNAIELMKGYHVYNLDQLMSSISEINKGIDIYQNDRNLTIPDFFTYREGLASERILKYLDL